MMHHDAGEQASASYTALVVLFFVSYVLIVGVVLMNIVIAVLLDEFISTVDRERQEARARSHAEEHSDADRCVCSRAHTPVYVCVWCVRSLCMQLGTEAAATPTGRRRRGH